MSAPQLAGIVLQLRAGHQRQLKQRAAAARQQEQDPVLCRQSLYQFHRLPGGGKAVFIRDGMSGFIARHAGDLPFDVTVFCNDDTVIHPAQCLYGGICHLPCSFSGSHQKGPARSGAEALQGAENGLVRQNGLQACSDDLVGIFSQGCIHSGSFTGPAPGQTNNKRRRTTFFAVRRPDTVSGYQISFMSTRT